MMQMLMLTIEFDKAKASSSNSTNTPKINRHKIFAPASPAFSGKAAFSSSGRRLSLRASDTGMDVVSMCYLFFFQLKSVLQSLSMMGGSVSSMF